MMKKLALLFLLLHCFQAILTAQSEKDSLVVFVGEKIEVTDWTKEKQPYSIDTIINGNDTDYVEHYSVSMDSKYIARYKVLELIHGTYQKDTIEFIVYDHYGTPAFSQYQTVLLFVSHHKGKLYHQKYQYFDLYPTDENKWASPYSVTDYNHSYKEEITVKPEKISFKDEVSYPIGRMTTEQIQRLFPEPYYRIKNGKAVAVYGNHVKELFILKQQTILKARGIY